LTNVDLQAFLGTAPFKKNVKLKKYIKLLEHNVTENLSDPELKDFCYSLNMKMSLIGLGFEGLGSHWWCYFGKLGKLFRALLEEVGNYRLAFEGNGSPVLGHHDMNCFALPHPSQYDGLNSLKP
jgi:hypothetical protein